MRARYVAAGSRPEWQFRSRQGVTWLAALAITAGAAVALAAGNQPLEYLDEETGATVTVVGRPLVFVHELLSTPGNAGDYVTLAAAAVDQSGKITYIVIAYFWSVGVSQPVSPAEAEPLSLQTDDQRIELAFRGASARDLGIGVPVHKPPFGTGTPYIYGIDVLTMRSIAESRHLTLRLGRPDKPLNYELLEDRRVALKEFVRRVDGRD
jgi:hypothetical protein